MDLGGHLVYARERDMERPRTTRTEAIRTITNFIERRFLGALPPLASGASSDEVRDQLRRLPLAETLALHGRALFEAPSLEPSVREQAALGREDFFTELGAAVGVSARAMLAAVRAREFPLEPPRPVEGFEYLGIFKSDGELDVADPGYLRKPNPAEGLLTLSHEVDGLPGTWHAFVRNGTGDAADRTAELAAIHDDGFEVVAAEEIARIGADAGMVGVFDRTCPRPVMQELGVEGVLYGLGAVAWSGYGDGIYPVFAGSAHGRVAKLRVVFLGERPEVDTTLPRRPAKPYAASATFATGDALDHVKFGLGTVLRAADGKIDVQFSDSTRTLIHGKR